MDCSIVREYISSYIDQELDDNNAAQIDLHIESCPACREELRAQMGLHRLLAEKLERSRTPEDLRRLILESTVDRATADRGKRFSLSWLLDKKQVEYRPAAVLAVAAMILVVLLAGGTGMYTVPDNAGVPKTAPFTDTGYHAVSQTIEIAEGVQATIVGQVVCIGCYLRDNYMLPYDSHAYGYHIGLLTNDGSLWSFTKNGESTGLLDNAEYIGRKLRIDGQLFYNAHFIDIHKFSDVTDTE